MAIYSVAKEDFMGKESLCETCKNAVPQLCAFIREEDSDAALASIGAEAVATKSFGNYYRGLLYKVISCPAYIRGHLPALHKTQPAGGAEKYDLSCPSCGSIKNVKIARTKYLSPSDWYCRCFTCNRSFRPRKKEVRNMESQDNVVAINEKINIKASNEELTKQDYIKLKNEGNTDKKIMALYNMSNSKFYKLKKEWELTGFTLARQNKSDDEIEWAEPGSSVINVPVLRICNNGISLNACAAKSLKEVKYLRIGAKKGLVVLTTSEDKTGCYSCRPSGSGIKIGGGGLAKFFIKRGIVPGKYLLSYNTEMNRWEARTDERI